MCDYICQLYLRILRGILGKISTHFKSLLHFINEVIIWYLLDPNH